MSWPWKKKSEKTSNAESSNNLVGNQGEQDETKVAKYVQVSPETYAHYVDLEEQVKVLNEEVNDLNDKISAQQAEMATKDGLVKQHAKVAEEAISGWEKAEAEASALKLQLETVTLAKLSVEERAAHLDGALKECMKQIRLVKEEGEQKLHDVVFAKTKQWEKLKAEFEAKMDGFEQELLRSASENAALTRSLQERSAMLMKIGDEKAKAEEEIEMLKSTIQARDKEIQSLKYEVHVVAKELEIRSEEKNMSIRSADVATKQHSEDIKKIAKLEAECQRLRGLVRKKLPGPAALAQMKLEVETLGWDSSESRSRLSSGRNSSFHQSISSGPDSFENFHQLQKENKFLTDRILAMEEETKMLKEALSKRNSELDESRSLCTKMQSKLFALEAELLSCNHGKSPSKSSTDIDGSIQPSLTSASEYGVDDGSESWATALLSELSQFKKGKDATKRNSTSESAKQIELMDDFLEMEQLASQTSEQTNPVCLDETKVEVAEAPERNESSLSSLELSAAILRIQDFVKLLRSEVSKFYVNPDHLGISNGVKDFDAAVGKFMCKENSLDDLIIAFSQVLSETNELKITVLTDKTGEGDVVGLEYVDKVTLLENGESEHGSMKENNICPVAARLSSDSELEVPSTGFETKTAVQVCSYDDYERLKTEKKNLEEELAKCNEMAEKTMSDLLETTRNMQELRSQLAASQKSNGLAETQLKCMAESYKLLESSKQDLDDRINLLQIKIEGLEAELAEERNSHQEDLSKLELLRDQIERYEKSGQCAEDDTGTKTKQQEKEIAAAAEKLAECQETILILGRQLQALRPPAEQPMSPKRRYPEDSSEHNEWPLDGMTTPKAAAAAGVDKSNLEQHLRPARGSMSPLSKHINHTPDTELSPSPPSSGPNGTKSRSRSSSSSSLPSLSSDKNGGRGFSRFFSKGKGEN